MKVLGIDPGTGRLGWAIVEKKKGKESMIECGCFETKKNSDQADRLLKIFKFSVSFHFNYLPSEKGKRFEKEYFISFSDDL